MSCDDVNTRFPSWTMFDSDPKPNLKLNPYACVSNSRHVGYMFLKLWCVHVTQILSYKSSNELQLTRLKLSSD